jgi:hypothetical protein
MSTTHLQIVNRLLRRLREDSVATVNGNEYSVMLGDIVADAYEEVQDEHEWEGLKHDIVVDIVPGKAVYEISRKVSDGGDVRNTTVRAATPKSEVVFLEDQPQIFLFDDDADDQTNHIIYISPEALKVRKNLDRDDTNIDPQFITWYLRPGPTGVPRLYVELYPEPATARVLEMTLWTPDRRLAVDGSTDSHVILVPDRPVWALALMWALNERGEEIGEPGNLAEQRYNVALSLAIETDIRNYERVGRYDWRRN